MTEPYVIAPGIYELRRMLKRGEEFPFHTLEEIDRDTSRYDFAEYAALGILHWLKVTDTVSCPYEMPEAQRVQLFGTLADLIREAHAQRGNDNR
ncbi:hypothetical protein BB934_45540 (plasmid) [Microvirga ossetica]|uniref:Uncharacterized protein n=1 Tax=Microvirga ossetica TaxID=1882682 RepID=A0A1B2EZU2_9HYPH|nr:hypothetical protein [Microvirga ossetica]ANY85486.1 hypothetical protein BB934_45540 [Microvirga ossetica]